MPTHEKKHCARCDAEFECKTGSVLLCQCSKIELSTEQLEYIHAEYEDCLCLSCLNVLRTKFNTLSYQKNMQTLLSGHGLTDRINSNIKK